MPGDERPTCWQQQLYLLLECPERSGLLARVLSHFILYMIIASIASFILETVPSLRDLPVWRVVEIISTVVFTIEFVLRFAVCDAYGESRLDFVRSPMNVLDLLAIIPFYFEELLSGVKPLRVLRSVRLIRCFRIIKLSKYSRGMDLMIEALVNSMQPLSILMFFLCIGVVLFSSLIYFAERISCPDIEAMRKSGTLAEYFEQCSQLQSGFARNGDLCCNERGSARDFESIPMSFWWSLVTMTTVGYGDTYPRTLLGYCVGTLAMLSGILLISLPVAIVGSKFQQAYEKSQQADFLAAREEELRQAQEAKAPPAIVPEAPLASPGRPRSGGKSQGASRQNAPPAPPESPASTSALQALASLRRRVRRIEVSPRLSEKATEQVDICLELFDHIERVEKQLAEHRERDAALDRKIRTSFTALSCQYDARQKMQQSQSSSMSETM